MKAVKNSLIVFVVIWVLALLFASLFFHSVPACVLCMLAILFNLYLYRKLDGGKHGTHPR